jgi:hypothetical protein
VNYELNKKGLFHGAIIGMVGIAISMVAYLVSNEAYFSWRSITIMIVSFALLIFFGRKERRENYNGYLGYSAAFWYCSIALFIMIYINQVSFIVVVNFVDPGLKDFILEKGIEATEMLYMAIEKDQSLIDEKVLEVEKDLKNEFNPFILIAGSWKFLVQAMVVGLITALFLRKNPPLFEEVEEEIS